MSVSYLRQRYEASETGNEVITPTASTKTLFAPWQSFKVSYGQEFLNRDDETRNLDEPLAQAPDAFDPTWSGTKRMYPDPMAFDLKHLLGNPVTTTGNGVITDPSGTPIPTGVTRHVWTAPFGPSGLVPITTMAEVAYTDEAVFFAMRGMGMDELKIDNQERGGVTVSTKGPATFVGSIANPSLTPVLESIATLPFRGGDLSVPTWLAGASKLSTGLSVMIANPIKTQRTLNIRSNFPDAMEKDDGLIQLSGEVDARLLDVQDLAAFTAQTQFAGLLRWQSGSNVPTTSYPYQLWIAANLQLDTYDIDELNNKRRHGAKVGFRAVRDAATSAALTLCCATPTLA